MHQLPLSPQRLEAEGVEDMPAPKLKLRGDLNLTWNQFLSEDARVQGHNDLSVGLHVVTLKIEARRLRIQEIDARRDAVRVRIGPDPPVRAEHIVALLRAERGRLKYLPDDKLEYRTDGTTPEARLTTARKLLHRMTAGVTVPP